MNVEVTCPRCGQEDLVEAAGEVPCKRCLHVFQAAHVEQLSFGGDSIGPLPPRPQPDAVSTGAAADPTLRTDDGGYRAGTDGVLDDPTEGPPVDLEVGEDVAHEPAVRGAWKRTQMSMEIEDVKPPYRIPLMSEINLTPKNGLRMVGTFSGCGGSSLGFKMAGWETICAAEFIPAAIDTYQANFPDVPVYCQDIRDYEPALVMDRFGFGPGDLDVLEGSPPCASFSTAGIRTEGWGVVKKYSDTQQRTDDLFDEYVRLVAGFRPKVFVAENVSGFLMGQADAYREWTETMLGSLGYVVWHKLLDASRLGVPQRRRRVIIVGVRRDVGIHPTEMYPDLLPYTYSIRDALPWLAAQTEGAHGFWPEMDTPADQPARTIRAGAYTMKVRDTPEHLIVANRLTSYHGDVIERPIDEPIATIMADGLGGDTQGDILIVPPRMEGDAESLSFEGYAIHEEWLKLHAGEQSDKYFSLIKPDADRPSPTLTATAGQTGAAGVTHPSEPRKFTIPELRRLSGFPDDFVLTGSYNRQWERLGRAVPPPMMAAVAAQIAKKLLA